MIVPTVKTCQNDGACSKERTFDSLAFETILRFLETTNITYSQVTFTRFHFEWPADFLFSLREFPACLITQQNTNEPSHGNMTNSVVRQLFSICICG